MTPARPTPDVDGLADVMAEVQRAQKPRLSSCCYEVGTSRCRCEPMCHIPARRIVDLLAHLTAVTAERDEARAAVERVRTWLDGQVDSLGRPFNLLHAYGLRAALDHVPTTEGGEE